MLFCANTLPHIVQTKWPVNGMRMNMVLENLRRSETFTAELAPERGYVTVHNQSMAGFRVIQTRMVLCETLFTFWASQ